MKTLTPWNTVAKITLGTALFALASLSQAALFQYSTNNPGSGNTSAGVLTSIDTTWNSTLDTFSWTHEIADVSPGVASDGFWLVVSDGPNPKTRAGEYGIFYGDANANRVSAYEYSGENNANSWNSPGIFQASYQLTTTRNSADNGTLFSFSFDGSTIVDDYQGNCTQASGNCNSGPNVWNESMWDYVGFGEQIGYWLHPALGTEFSYDGTGGITDFQFEQQGWYDRMNLATAANVSEPTTLSLLALALGFSFMRRRKV